MTCSKDYIERAEHAVLHTYNRYQIVLEKGKGVRLYDLEGKEYLDFGAGIAVFALGYGNEDYNQALKDQIDKLIHTSNLFYNVPMTEAAEKLLKASGIISKYKDGVKILGRGELNKKLTVKVDKFSASAAEKIEKAGGKVEVI